MQYFYVVSFFFLVGNLFYFPELKGGSEGFFTCPDQSSSFFISPETTDESLTPEKNPQLGFSMQPWASVIHQPLHKMQHNFQVGTLQMQKMLFKYFALKHTCSVQGHTNMLLTMRNIKVLLKKREKSYLLK